MQEQGFKELSEVELAIGYEYAIDVCGSRVDWATLKVVGNHAGAIRKASPSKTPREAATEALRAWERRNRTRITSVERFNAYVRSIAKMLSERNPKTRAKRIRERELADLKAAS